MQLNTGGSTAFSSRNYGGEFCILFHTSGAYERYINQSVWIQLEEGTAVNSYIPYKQNKIQFSLSEPLRAIGNIKDKLCIKDNKLVVERNCGYLIINGTETITHHKLIGGTSSYRIENVLNKNGAKILVDKYPVVNFSILYDSETKCVCTHSENNITR